MRNLLQDIRYALRVLLKQPVYTFSAVITLALGIGANTAIFSVVNSLLLRPLPYRDDSRLMMVWENHLKEANPHNAVAPANFFDWREQNQVFEQMAAFTEPINYNLIGTDAPQRVLGIRVTANFFQTLGVQPLHGRAFVEEEDEPDKNLVIVVSHALWQRQFGGDPGAVGKIYELSKRQYNLIGVLPPDFRMPPDFQSAPLDNVEMWTPLAANADTKKRRSSHYLSVVARLKPGATAEGARAEMNTIASRLQQQYPETNVGWGAAVVPIKEEFVSRVRLIIYVLFAAVCFVLLIACANVANLLLSRATGRQKEIAVRLALGASRRRLVQQLLTESMVLAVAGGLLGLLLAWWGVRMIVAFSPSNIPRIGDIQLDASMLAYTAVIAVLTGVIFGLAPAIQASRPNMNDSLKEGTKGGAAGQGRNRLRDLLIISEVGLSLMLLIGAGLMVRSFRALQEVNFGFDPQGVLTAQVALPSLKYKSRDQAIAFYDQVLERVEGLPGVEAAAKVSELPLTGQQFDNTFSVEGRAPAAPGQEDHANLRLVSHNYFRAMGMQLQKGRPFAPQDAAGQPGYVIINESMARRFWPGEDPLGKRLTINLGEPGPREIVGIVEDIRHYAPDVNPKPEMYVPNLPLGQNIMSLVVRSQVEPQAMATALRAAVAAVDKDQAVYNIKPLSQIVDDSIARQRFSMLLLVMLSVIAVVLTVVGIYGVLSYWVTQRRHEIGIRMALGANTRSIVWLVVQQGMLLAAIGIALGVAGSLAMTRVISNLLYGIGATDPATFVGTTLVLATLALLSTLIPARRAAGVDPLIALRDE